MKVAIIGCGNLGASLALGLIRANLDQLDLALFDRNPTKTASLSGEARGKSVRAVASTKEALARADVVLLVVKPKDITKTLAQLRDDLTTTSLLISCAAGIPAEEISATLNKRVPVARAMPNTAVALAASTTAVFMGPNCDLSRDEKRVNEIFGAMGQVRIIKSEESMHAVTALAGCGPAFVLAMLESMMDAGVRAGLARNDADIFARGALHAATALAEHSALPPADLRAQIASPGGATIEGLYQLEKGGFRGIVMDAVDAAVRRSHQLTGK